MHSQNSPYYKFIEREKWKRKRHDPIMEIGYITLENIVEVVIGDKEA